jgi:hypothetical protein
VEGRGGVRRETCVKETRKGGAEGRTGERGGRGRKREVKEIGRGRKGTMGRQERKGRVAVKLTAPPIVQLWLRH